MQVTLVRHGAPVRCHAGWLTRAGYDAWGRAYAAAGLRDGAAPPARLVALADEAALVVSSDLRRARESAALLRPGAPDEVWPLLREADLPAPALAGTVRLPLLAWLVAGRVGWGGGRLAGVEPIAAARGRAAEAARVLERAAAGGPVVAVGHAVFHGLVAGALRRRGWRGPWWWAGRYWASATLHRDG